MPMYRTPSGTFVTIPDVGPTNFPTDLPGPSAPPPAATPDAAAAAPLGIPVAGWLIGAVAAYFLLRD